MKTIQILFFTLFFASSVTAQSTEKFIRIIGNAKKEITAQKAKVEFSINEMKANRYDKNSKDISYEDAYNSAITEFSKIGIKEDELQLIISASRHNRKSYYLITDKNKLEKISKIKLNSLKIRGISYLFDSSDENLETELSLQAIKDAKRKAKAICDEIDMRVGKILNIEVKDSSYGTEKIENSKESIIKSYKIAITFKLID